MHIMIYIFNTGWHLSWPWWACICLPGQARGNPARRPAGRVAQRWEVCRQPTGRQGSRVAQCAHVWLPGSSRPRPPGNRHSPATAGCKPLDRASVRGCCSTGQQQNSHLRSQYQSPASGWTRTRDHNTNHRPATELAPEITILITGQRRNSHPRSQY